MKKEYLGLEKINGPLVFIQTPPEIGFNEQVEFIMKNGEIRIGNVIAVREDITIIQVYEGSKGISLQETKTALTGKPLRLKLSDDMLGRIFDGVGRPIDGLGKVISMIERDINGNPMNPVARKYPRNFIETGISVIDGLMTLIRGQKLPIFSGSGLPHNELAEQMIRNANIKGEGKFAIVFGLMGVEYETAEFFKKSFAEERSIIKSSNVSKSF